MIVNRYSQALFIVSKEQNALDDVLRNYETMVGALKEVPKWIDYFASPVIKLNDKKKLILGINNVNPIINNFFIMLVMQHHLHLYELIYDEFLKLTRNEQKIAYVRIIVAKRLSGEQLSVLKEELYGWFEDKELEIEVIIDKRLLGGIRIMYQGQTIDRSFYSELQELKVNV